MSCRPGCPFDWLCAEKQKSGKAKNKHFMDEMVANGTEGESMLCAEAAWMKGSGTVGALLIINSCC